MSNTDRAWLNFSSQQQLEYLQKCSGRQTEKPVKTASCAVLEGKFIYSKTAFLCELGEALFGNGGFCGRTLEEAASVLNSSLSSPYNTRGLRKIIWRDADVSLQNLGEDDFYLCLTVLQHALAECTLVYKKVRRCW